LATGDFQDLYTQALYAAQRDTSVAFDVTRAKAAVNTAYFNLCDDGTQWAFLATQGEHTLTTGDETYSYSDIATSLSVTGITDVLAVNFGGPAGSYPGHYVRWEDYWAIRQLNPSLANGVPHLWTTTGRSEVQIWPKPDSTYTATVLVLQRPAELVSNSDEPLLPIGWRSRLLVPAAAAILLREEGGGEASSAAAELDARYFKAIEGTENTSLVLQLPVSHPTPAEVALPAGLQGATNSFLELAQRVCYETNTAPWIGDQLDRAKEAVNSVYQSLLNSNEDWDFIEREGRVTLTAGADTYSTDTFATALGVGSIRQILNIVNDSSANTPQLEALSWDELESLTKSSQDGETQDQPAAYAVWNNKVRFWPSPDKAYTLGIYYLAGAAPLALDTDVPLFPAEWLYEVIVPLAGARVLYQSGDATKVQKAQVLEGRGNAAYKRLVEFHASAKAPTLNLQSPKFASDLPGTYAQDWYF
jgi:hypothetical protein